MFYYRLILCSLLLLSGCSSDSQSKSVIIKNGTSIENRIKIYKDLVKDLCKSDEKVNRHFLQQTWYHSKEFKFFAYIFDTNSFAKHENNQPFSMPEIEGIYCIDGNNINALYYKQDFVPGDVSLKKRTLHFNEELTFLRKEIIKVISIDRQEMVLSFSNSNTQQSYYRKN